MSQEIQIFLNVENKQDYLVLFPFLYKLNLGSTQIEIQNFNFQFQDLNDELIY